ncbi:MAG: phosphate ABC transporter substrate-binding protein, partial [Synergistaceae bacterium]|nr:phosphate ABC transporter substrate-binding protein [Synergistaceae bacterium]
MKKFAAVLAACAVLSISGAAFANAIVMNGSTTVLPIA